MISRRTLLNTAGATAVLAGVPLFRVHAEDAPIKLGCIEDNSGVLDIYGKPIVMANALQSKKSTPPAVCSGARSSSSNTTASRISRSTPNTLSSSSREDKVECPWRHHLGVARSHPADVPPRQHALFLQHPL